MNHSGMVQLCEMLEGRRLLSSVTLVTHGYSPDSSFPFFVPLMGQAIGSRAGEDAVGYTIHVEGDLSTSIERSFGPSTVGADSDVVLMLDWGEPSNFAVYPTRGTASVAAAVLPYFLQAQPEVGIGTALSNLPIHLIGHSRGGSLVSSLASQLGKAGVTVDQLTLLDPIPVGNDAPAVVPSNVVFADNYFQTDDPIFKSAARSGAHNTNLTPLDLDHGDVVAYYLGTIATGLPTGFGIDAAWYQAPFEGRAETGFAYSRIAMESGSGVARPADGLHDVGGGGGGGSGGLAGAVTSVPGALALGAKKNKVTVSVTNDGDAATAKEPVQVVWVASKDATVSSDDVQVSSGSKVVSVQPGKSVKLTQSFVTPVGLASGDYYLLATVNGTAASAPGSVTKVVAPTVDLSVSFLGEPTSVTGAKATPVRVRVTNEGNVTATGSAVVQLLLSGDRVAATAGSELVSVTKNLRVGAGKSVVVTLKPVFAVGSGGYLQGSVVFSPASGVPGDSDSSDDVVFSDSLIEG